MWIKIASMMALALIAGCAERKSTSSTSADSQPKEFVAVLEEDEGPSAGFKPVKEMLSRNCGACHDPGGKMYEELPFDNPEIVSAHGASILPRLNETTDKDLLQQWLSALQRDKSNE